MWVDKEGIILIGLACIAGLTLGYVTFGNKSKQQKNVTSKQKKKTNEKANAGNGNGVLKEKSEFRGYYHTSDGRKTTYFNRELSQEEKALIGDISPKRIDTPTKSTPDSVTKGGSSSSNSDHCGSSSSRSNDSGSAWNAAGTFEEKVVDKWATETITELLKAVTVTEQGISLTTHRVEKIEGDAAMTVVRGKKRYIYDFTCQVRWKARILDKNKEEYEGAISITDITGEKCYEIDPWVDFPSISDRNCKSNIEKALKGSYKDALKMALDEFLHTFKNKY